MRKNPPIALLILDGWGHSEATEHNAIATAPTPHWDQLWQQCPRALLDCSGAAVGLPEGQMGNSEVGHMSIGSGRIIPQDFTRISDALSTGSLASNETLLAAIAAHKPGATFHVMGLLSPGGVHSHEHHIQAMIELLATQGIEKIALHAFLDGRDTPPKSAQTSLAAIEATFSRLGCGRITSIIGRYYAMDRDQRWQRIASAYQLIVTAQADYHATTSIEALTEAYARGESDEFVKATLIGESQPVAVEDSMLFMNFRADRARQLSQCFTDPKFDKFQRSSSPIVAQFLTLTDYGSGVDAAVIMKPFQPEHTLGAVVAAAGLNQHRIAETEKYAHVTFFLNGGREEPFAGEARVLVPSPKVATYDLQPEMHAMQVADAITDAIRAGNSALIVANFANADMVGHSGNFAATCDAIAELDRCLGVILQAAEKHQVTVLITADHGNAEQMFDSDAQQQLTSHTTSPVPFICSDKSIERITSTGQLSDIAPTVLQLLGLPIPDDMTGQPIFERRG